jgi:hypothetical protein
MRCSLLQCFTFKAVCKRALSLRANTADCAYPPTAELTVERRISDPLFLPTMYGPQLCVSLDSSSTVSASAAPNLPPPHAAGLHINSIHLSHVLRLTLEAADLERVNALLIGLTRLQLFEVTYDAIPACIDPWSSTRVGTYLVQHLPNVPIRVRQANITFFAHAEVLSLLPKGRANTR